MRTLEHRFNQLRSVISNIYDFYLLEAVSAESVNFSSAPQKKWKNDLIEWNNKLVADTALAIRDYLYLSAAGEARHAWKTCNIAIDELHAGGRTETYLKIAQYGPSPENIKALIEVFGNTWRKTGYGGKKWLQIIEAVSHYGEWPDSIFIDHAADLQHNNGTVFSKSETETILDFKINVNRNTIQKWLYNKKKNDIIKTGNSPYNLQTAMKTKTLLKRFFVTRKITPPNWITTITTIPVEEATYKPYEWGNKKFSAPKTTGLNWKKKKSIWKCICFNCQDIIIICNNCKEPKKECKCCDNCSASPGNCICCTNCGNPNCDLCYICDEPICQHFNECCTNCKSKKDNCNCCPICGYDCLWCPECEEYQCEHKNNIICEDLEETDDEKEETKETEEEKEIPANATTQNAISDPVQITDNLETMSHRK